MTGKYQCAHCGCISNIEQKNRPRSDTTYVSLWCDKCKKVTRQLYCGDEDDIYWLYDVVMDERYYKYNTK